MVIRGSRDGRRLPKMDTGSLASKLPQPLLTPAPQRLLLVDDDERSTLVLAEKLRRIGFFVDAVDNQDEAMWRLLTSSYDAVILEPYRTGTDSADSLRLIRHCRSISPSTSLVVLSSYCGAAYVREASALGVALFLDKEESLQLLVNEVQELLARPGGLA